MNGIFKTDFFGGRIVDDLNKHFRMIVTPECAKEMLKRNHNNRSLRKELVKKYSRLISQDLWNANVPGSIVFSADGELIDGQHRLSAVIDANKAAKFNITVLAYNASLDGIDVGLRRNTKDILKMEYGKTANHYTIAAVTMFIRYREYDFNVSTSIKNMQIGESEIIKEFTKNEELWQKAEKIVRTGSHQRLAFSQSSVLATFLAIQCGVSEDKLVDFFTIVNSGTLLPTVNYEKTNIALLTRKFLTDSRENGLLRSQPIVHEGIMEEYIQLFIKGVARKKGVQKPTWYYAKKYGECHRTVPAISESETVPSGYKSNSKYIETKNKRVQLLVQPSVVDALKASAKASGVSLNELANRTFKESLETTH